MDWFIWLSKTSLDPSLVYEYGLALTNNELEEDDIAYFNHEFLQSMGISIAKHRLEILKLARKYKVPNKKHPMLSKLLFVLKNTKKSLTHYIATLVHHRGHDDNRALILLPNNKNNKNNKVIKSSNMSGGALSYSSRWRRSMMMKNNNKKLVMVNSKNNNISSNYNYTNNRDYLGDDAIVVSTPKLDSYSSPLMYDLQQSKGEKVDDNHGDDDDDVDDQYWSPTLEEIRWDAMFQDLKPT
ncbi:hypothetical protein vseg_018454 [Gypsophila vaccaria]